MAEKEFDVLCCRCGTVVRHYTRIFVDHHGRIVCIGFCLSCVKKGRLVLTREQLEEIIQKGRKNGTAGVRASGVTA